MASSDTTDKTSREDLDEKGESILGRVLKEVQGEAQLLSRGPAAEHWSVELTLIDADEMQKLNCEFRAKDYPTDILSFPADDPFWSHGILGELLICRPVLERQAAERALTAEQELHILIVHGVLHLLGLEHEFEDVQDQEQTEIQAKIDEMLRWERQILEKTVPPVWVKETQGRCLSGLIERVECDKKGSYE